MRTKWFDKVEPLKEGDLVLVADEGRRGQWRRGIIIEAVSAKDGQVRAVTIKTATGVLRRPATKVAKI